MEELKHALEVIKKTCITSNNCSVCPLRTARENCSIAGGKTPDKWHIGDVTVPPRIIR